MVYGVPNREGDCAVRHCMFSNFFGMLILGIGEQKCVERGVGTVLHLHIGVTCNASSCAAESYVLTQRLGSHILGAKLLSFAP